MKKVLFLALFCLLTLLPANVSAMVEYDENGKPIEKEIKENEMRIMTEPDAPVSSDEGTTIPSDRGQIDVKEPDKRDIPVGAEPAIDGRYEKADDLYRTLGVEDDALFNTTSQEQEAVITSAPSKKDNNNLPSILIGGSAGIILGAIGTYLFLKRK